MNDNINKVIGMIIVLIIIVEFIKFKRAGKFTINKGKGINILERIRYSLFKGQLELLGVFETTVIGKETTVNRRNIATNHYLILSDPSKKMVGKVSVLKADYFNYEIDSAYGRKAFFTNRNNPHILIISREKNVEKAKRQILLETRITLMIISIVTALLLFTYSIMVYRIVN